MIDGRQQRQLLTVSEACEMLDISRATMYRRILNRYIKPVRLHPSGHPRIRLSDLETFLKERQCEM